MHQIFTFYHLILEICSHATRSQLPVLARISSYWFKCAIPLLYKFIDLKEALELSKKIVSRDRTQGYSFRVSHSLGGDFKRFSKYTPYIQDLRMDSCYVSNALKVMRTAASGENPYYLFPNIRTLLWQHPEYSPECRELSTSLISPKIDKLSLIISDYRTLDYLFPLVMRRLSDLRSVTMVDDTIKVDIAEDFVKPMQDLFTCFAHTLTSVIIPITLNTPAIVECLSKMPNLRELSMKGREEQRDGIRDDTPLRGFTSLRCFWFDGYFESFCNMFLNPYRLPSLTTLNVKYSCADINAIVSFIVAACPHIKTIIVGERLTDPWAYYFWPGLPWQSAQFTSRHEELTSLAQNWMRCSFTLEQLTDLLQSRAKWARLHVSPSFPLRLQDTLRHCSNPNNLAIYINDHHGFIVVDPPPSTDSGDPPTFWTHAPLTINIACGSTTRSTSYAIARFLLRVCKLKKPPTYELCELDDDLITDVSKRLGIHYLNQAYAGDRPGMPVPSRYCEFKEFIEMMIMKGTQLN